MIYTQPILTVWITHLIENYALLKQLAPQSIPAAVVKNDAYGVGIKRVVPALYQQECRHFFVAHACEGSLVRSLAPDACIYVLQGMGDDTLSLFHKNHLTPVISTPSEWIFWKQNAIPAIKPILNVETGLNRLGFRQSDLALLSESDKKQFSYIMSHLACADEAQHFMNQNQLTLFDQISALFPNTPRSLAASDGVFLGAPFQKEMTRLGAALYGLNTAPYRQNKMKPVLSVQAPVLQTAFVPKGDYIGYGATYQAPCDRRIGIVSMGYADGLCRSLTGRGRAFFKEEELRFVGRISMDNVMCDITDSPDLSQGDYVDILNDTYTVDKMAQDAGTIGYEILNGIGKGSRFHVIEK